MAQPTLYTHDLAAACLEQFENVLSEQNIVLTSPEDDEKEPDNEACIYGSTYSNLLDNIESIIINHLKPFNMPVTTDVFSSNM